MGEGISAASGGEGWVNHLSSRTFLGSILKPAQCEEFFRHIPGPRKNRLEIAIALLSFRGSSFSLPPDMELRLPSSPQVLRKSRPIGQVVSQNSQPRNFE